MELVGKFTNPVVMIIALVTLAVATLSVNIAANVVPPSNDFSNAFPKLVSFKIGGIITGVVGIVIMPWRLLSDPSIYIFSWLSLYSGALGAIAGVMAVDYWLIRKTRLSLTDLYVAESRYGKWNWRAIIALAIGMLFAIGGYNDATAGMPNGWICLSVARCLRTTSRRARRPPPWAARPPSSISQFSPRARP